MQEDGQRDALWRGEIHSAERRDEHEEVEARLRQGEEVGCASLLAGPLGLRGRGTRATDDNRGGGLHALASRTRRVRAAVVEIGSGDAANRARCARSVSTSDVTSTSAPLTTCSELMMNCF